MILTIIAIVAIGVIVAVFLIMALSIAYGIFTGNWEFFSKDFGWFLFINSGFALGFSIGAFTIGNILNFMTDGYFAINICNPNKAGIILLAICMVFGIIGKTLMDKGEEKQKIQKDKYVILKSGKRVKID